MWMSKNWRLAQKDKKYFCGFEILLILKQFEQNYTQIDDSVQKPNQIRL